MPPEPFFIRHDLHVVAIAAIILALGGWLRHASGDTGRAVSKDRLSLVVPADWMAEPSGGDRTVLRGEDAVTRVELRVADKPSELVTVDSILALERGQRYGGLYQRLDSGKVAAGGPGGRVWQRTVFTYAFKPTPTHAPRLATAVEYAFAGEDHLYVATVHAPDEERARELERALLGTLVLR